MKVPCYKCEDRELHCHSTCEKYLEYSKQKEEDREMRRKETESIISHRDHVIAAIKRLNRRRK